MCESFRRGRMIWHWLGVSHRLTSWKMSKKVFVFSFDRNEFESKILYHRLWWNHERVVDLARQDMVILFRVNDVALNLTIHETHADPILTDHPPLIEIVSSRQQADRDWFDYSWTVTVAVVSMNFRMDWLYCAFVIVEVSLIFVWAP